MSSGSAPQTTQGLPEEMGLGVARDRQCNPSPLECAGDTLRQLLHVDSNTAGGAREWRCLAAQAADLLPLELGPEFDRDIVNFKASTLASWREPCLGLLAEIDERVATQTSAAADGVSSYEPPPTARDDQSFGPSSSPTPIPFAQYMALATSLLALCVGMPVALR